MKNPRFFALAAGVSFAVSGCGSEVGSNPLEHSDVPCVEMTARSAQGYDAVIADANLHLSTGQIREAGRILAQQYPNGPDKDQVMHIGVSATGDLKYIGFDGCPTVQNTEGAE